MFSSNTSSILDPPLQKGQLGGFIVDHGPFYERDTGRLATAFTLFTEIKTEETH